VRKLTANIDPAAIGRITLDEALALLPTPDGKRSAAVFEHGTLQVKLYAPRGSDPQSPHTRDEVYVVARGEGWFVIGELTGEQTGERNAELSKERRYRFGANDVLFAKAGTRHRFEDFSDDLAVWVMFYGPEGGERDQ
jgi:mannose-6-phosphate isomerase-like protein (cupin superfamily)